MRAIRAARFFHSASAALRPRVFSQELIKREPPPRLSTAQSRDKTLKRKTIEPQGNGVLDGLVALDDPDVFGTLSRTHEMFTEKFDHDEDDQKEDKFISERPLKSAVLSTKKYADMIKEYLLENRIKEALDVLKVRMLVEDRAKPEPYIYELLISGCARVGYTKEAFKLYNDMKRRVVRVRGGIYTSLFCACANSPTTSFGLEKAQHLRNLMKEKTIEPNLTMYNAMVKAFGRCGDLVTAFSIVDEMVSKKIQIRHHTYNFLLQACISDKQSGFRHALVTWRKMIKNKQRPGIYSFNLMLRCIKDCSIGDNLNGVKLIEQIIPDSRLISSSEIANQTPKLGGNSGEACSLNTLAEIKFTPSTEPSDAVTNRDNDPLTDTLPNLLSKTPHMGSVLQINNISTAEERFMLVGGLDGFLKECKCYKVAPNIKTVTQLLDVTPNTLEYDEKILTLIKQNKILPDIEFYNMLIKRRSYREDYEAGKAVLKIIEKESKRRKRYYVYSKNKHLNANIMTYGVWALCCNTHQDAEELLNKIKEKRSRVNIEILGTLLGRATKVLDCDYAMYIMKTVIEEKLAINERFLRHLNYFNAKCKRTIKNKNVENTDKIDDNLEEKYKSYLDYYHTTWTRNITNDETEKLHPWAQFKINQPETFQRPSKKVKKLRIYKKKGRPFIKYKVRA